MVWWGGVRILGGDMTVSGLLQGRGWLFATFSAFIAVVVSFAFRAFEALQQQAREREWAEKEIELARLIQTRLLPPERIEGSTFAINARNLPARLVAGDFYDVVQLEDGSVAIVVADVAGKGMGASLIMASVKAVLPFVARQPVAEAMNTLNAKLIRELGKREFVALTFARYFPADGTLHMVNAGCPDPYLLRNGSIDSIAAQGERLPLGVRQGIRYETAVSRVKPGDRLVFLTDGIPEAPGSAERPIGYVRVAEILLGTRGDLDAFLAKVRAEVQPTLADDWTALVLDVR